MEIGTVNPRSQEVVGFVEKTIEWSSIDIFPHMALMVMIICKIYRLIFVVWLFNDFNELQAVDDSTTKKNICVETGGFFPS
jgi:hypothetical protein